MRSRCSANILGVPAHEFHSGLLELDLYHGVRRKVEKIENQFFR
jgi:hypothetical protein